MGAPDEARYRLRLAQGFLAEAREDEGLQRWRSCVDNSQLATENAAKAVLALVGPVGRTHQPAVLLRRGLAERAYPASSVAAVEQLAERAEFLGPDVHVQSDYGDETGGRTPWEIFDREAAQQALAWAGEATQLAASLIDGTDQQ